MTLVKICGLRTIEHALVAAEAGADLLGFILAPSRRQIQPAELRAIADAVRQRVDRIGLVGVFVNAEPDEMAAIARECDLDAIQLSGDEDAGVLANLPDLMLFKAIRFDAGPREQAWLQPGLSPRLRLLVDAHVPGAYGGAGVLADWERAAALARQHPIALAGGLTPDNVGEAIRRVRPWAVDVSSGVETGGVKDVAKIRAFVEAARVTGSDRPHSDEGCGAGEDGRS